MAEIKTNTPFPHGRILEKTGVIPDWGIDSQDLRSVSGKNACGNQSG